MTTLVAEREELRHLVDLVPDDKLPLAICALEEYLEPNEETLQAIEDVMTGRNLLGPFDSVEEMMEAMLRDDDDATPCKRNPDPAECDAPASNSY